MCSVLIDSNMLESLSRTTGAVLQAERIKGGSQDVRTVGAAITLLALWLLLSGIYKPLVVGEGVLSVLVAVFVITRMDAVDDDRIELDLRPIQTTLYFFWLLIEIAKANWAVTRIILSPRMPIRQHLFTIPYSQKTDLGQVIFANSITLTPGTITIETEPDNFLVHAVAYSESDPDALAEMDRRVTLTERKAA